MTDSNLSRDEAIEIAEEAAAKALSQLFQYFDINLNDQDSLREFRRDLDHLRKQRTDIERARGIIRWTGLTITMSLIPGVLWWIWQVIIPWIQKQ